MAHHHVVALVDGAFGDMGRVAVALGLRDLDLDTPQARAFEMTSSRLGVNERPLTLAISRRRGTGRYSG